MDLDVLTNECKHTTAAVQKRVRDRNVICDLEDEITTWHITDTRLKMAVVI